MTTPIQLREALKRHPRIRQALVFGSMATGTAGAESDLDIAVEAEHALGADEKAYLIAELAALTGRPVDLIDLKTIGEPLLGEVLRHGQRILGSSTDHAELIRRHVFESEDFQPYVSRMLRERRQAWTG